MSMLARRLQTGSVPREAPPVPGGAYRDEVLVDSPYWLYRMADANGSTTATDASANNNDGTYEGVPTIDLPGGPTAGKVMLQTNSGHRILGTALPGSLTTMTLECWVRLTQNTGETYLIASDPGSGTRNFFWRVEADGRPQIATINNGVTFVKADTAVNDGGWHHLAAVCDGTEIRLYLDGVLDATPVAKSGNFTNATQIPIYVGFRGTAASGGDGGSGQFAEAAVYTTALTAARIAAHHGAADPVALPTSGDPDQVGSGLVCWIEADSLTLSNSDPVVTVTDSGPRGEDWTAAGTPTYVTNVLNSLPAIRFGLGDYLTFDSAHRWRGMTMFAVVSFDTSAAG